MSFLKELVMSFLKELVMSLLREIVMSFLKKMVIYILRVIVMSFLKEMVTSFLPIEICNWLAFITLYLIINSLIYESVNKKCSCRVVVGRYHFDEYWLYVSQRFIWTEYRIRLEMLYIYRGLASLMFLEYHKILVLDQNWIFQIINFQVCHNESVSKLKVLMVKVSSEYSNKKYCSLFLIPLA